MKWRSEILAVSFYLLHTSIYVVPKTCDATTVSSAIILQEFFCTDFNVLKKKKPITFNGTFRNL